MSEELKPCPFCGGNANRETGRYALRWAWCENPSCRAFARAELPIDRWNTRPIEDDLEEEVREKRKVILDSAGEIQRLEAELARKDDEIKALDEVLEKVRPLMMAGWDRDKKDQERFNAARARLAEAHRALRAVLLR